jgi:hypothetical protein
MQDGETLGAHAETPELLWNPQSKPAKLASLSPKRLIERVLAVDEPCSSVLPHRSAKTLATLSRNASRVA